MKNPTMLYKCPGPHSTDGIAYDYTIVAEADVEATLSAGWHRNWHAADAARKAAAQQLADNERKLAETERQLKEAAEQTETGSTGLRAVHKGRGSWSLFDANGNELQTGLTKEEAQAAIA